MSEFVALLDPRTAPRKRDAQATRGAILEAAKTHFARYGFDRSILRDIAADAGSDVALVKRYFGGKEGLFTEALKATFHADRMKEWNRETFAKDTATYLADGAHADEERTRGFQFLLRAATSPTTAPMLNRAVQELFLAPIREWLGGEDAGPRARVLAAVYIGFLVERLIRDEPLAGHERKVFIERGTAMFDALLTSPARQVPARRSSPADALY
ncbi:TetR family transcriptional regulator [Phenylobacterium sp.]|uniref:TetR/AcrR family transcriptional regulator n=1 Tax=Phenylobacterium sp. TaxID=1871053 RepID=UPI0035AE96F7